MFETLTISERNIAIQRLTALWALNECGLGGVLHALNSPFTGLLVGSFAMVCIAFICALAEHKWRAVMASLMIVLIIKALVSPHSTPTAYVAVAFQGITGAFIYRYIPNLLLSSVFFLTLGLIESGLQRLIMLTVLYGNTLWEAINIWGAYVTRHWGLYLPFTSSQAIIYTYLAIHLVVGVMMGWFLYRALTSVHARWGQHPYQLTLGIEDKREFFKKENKSKKKWKRYLLMGILVLVIVLAYSGLTDQTSNIQKGILAVVRAAAILTVWFVFLAPLFVHHLQKFLKKKHQTLSTEVAQTMDMFPQLLWIIEKAWKESGDVKFLKRWKKFIIHTMLYILQFQSAHDTDPGRADTK